MDHRNEDSKVVATHKGSGYLFSKEWANDTLRYYLREILPPEKGWLKHPQNKVIIANNLIRILEDHGFWWQADRIRNHLNKFLNTLRSSDRRSRAVLHPIFRSEAEIVINSEGKRLGSDIKNMQSCTAESRDLPLKKGKGGSSC